MIDKLTMSLCPACYREIPALIEVGPDGVFMTKTCKTHGVFQGMVERDPRWYSFCKEKNSNNIYDGYFIDVTDKCNIRCKACFHPLGKTDRPVGEIVKDATDHVTLAPFILTGGEPTVHPELPSIISQLAKVGETWVLTNGVEMQDERYLFELMKAGLHQEGNSWINIGLSLHAEAKGADIGMLELLRSMGLKAGSVQIVVDNVQQIEAAVSLFEVYKDTITVMKIKAATNLWHEQRVGNHLFVSDMLTKLRGMGGLTFQEYDQKVSFAAVMFKGLPLHLVSWYGVGNVDLQDIECPPYYMAKDGRVLNFVTACLVNEGTDAVQGGVRVRRAVASDVEGISHLWKALILEDVPGSLPNREAWASQSQALILNPNHYLLVAEKDGTPIGFQSGDVALEPGLNEVCVMGRHFYVAPEYRHSGVAKRLNDLTLDLGKRAGVTAILRPIQPRLLDFWKSKGGEVASIIMKTGYVGE